MGTSTCQCQVPKESLKSHFPASRWVSLEVAELQPQEKGPSIERAAGDTGERLSIQTSEEEGSGAASSHKQSLPSGGRTQGEASLDKEAREQTHFPLLGALIVESQ